MSCDTEPVVIGGVGGSGTRLVARLVQGLDFYIGDELNSALDNLWFALLLNRPIWYRSKPEEVQLAIQVFGKAMRGDRSLDPAECALLQSAAELKGGQAHERARTMRNSSGPPEDARGWGWKNPASHIYLEHLAVSFPGMRYIHIVRNGLDLASKNKLKMQVRYWGSLFGIDVADCGDASPRTALRYWSRANELALRLSRELFDDHFLPLRYESICSDPRGAVEEVAAFLGVRPRPGLSETFAASIKV